MSASDRKRRNRISGKDIRDAFLKPSDKKGGVWERTCGTLRKQSGSSYANLVSHVKQEYPRDFKNLLEDKGLGKEFITSESAELSSFFYKKKLKQIYCWLNEVINSFQHF